MIINLVILLLVVGLAVLFGWGTYRAIRSRKLWGKIAGGLGAVLSGAGMFGSPPAAMPGPITAPPPGVTAEYGKYVATYADCRGCHGPDMTGAPATSFSAAVPNPRPSVSVWGKEQFFRTMRTGVRPSGAPFTEAMPWRIASRLTDDDLAALYAYLIALGR